MTVRTWVYDQLTTFPGLVALIEDRTYAKKSMTSAMEQHPYIVYKLGHRAAEGLSEDDSIARQFIQVFVHDYSDGEVADYMGIDEVLTQVRAALHLGESAEDGVIMTKYLETSQDLNDETLNTVMKYARFQLITKEM